MIAGIWRDFEGVERLMAGLCPIVPSLNHGIAKAKIGKKVRMYRNLCLPVDAFRVLIFAIACQYMHESCFMHLWVEIISFFAKRRLGMVVCMNECCIHRFIISLII